MSPNCFVSRDTEDQRRGANGHRRGRSETQDGNPGNLTAPGEYYFLSLLRTCHKVDTVLQALPKTSPNPSQSSEAGIIIPVL